MVGNAFLMRKYKDVLKFARCGTQTGCSVEEHETTNHDIEPDHVAIRQRNVKNTKQRPLKPDYAS